MYVISMVLKVENLLIQYNDESRILIYNIYIVR